ncbi:hypothetical protein SNE40_020287 [Patella caerulea]|uniref:Regulator of G-protein signaling 7 n=1 Tax=Patella caerulea TaxID=87958 RepID=A0AAN8J078_PATCE
METLIQEMQNPKTGVSVKCQKSFLYTIPSVFTGVDVVSWLKKRLKISDSDSGEATHLANLLCKFGYFFPVSDSKLLVVKDDASLYRFQCPYYWPSQSMEPDNVAYAIHLAKRSMRNKQKHGLEDFEQTALTKLQKMLCDKWGFICTQAEDQVRLAKERKRTDKLILDSQERAFWRIHRPPPGQIKCIEDGPKRNFQPSQMANRKRKNREFLQKEVIHLRNAINRCRLKTSKAIESYLVRVEQYEDNDPFLSGVLPSNPWITEDITFFETNSDIIDTPTEQRIKKWAVSFHELLTDPLGLQEFENFLKKEYSQENIRFWAACEQLKFCPVSEIPGKIECIYEEFLTTGSPHEVNIDSKTMESVQLNRKLKKPSRFTFEAAKEHIYTLMKKDSYPRFLRSEHYKSLLANAFAPFGKKKFFNFGSSRKKNNNLSLSPQPKRRSSEGKDCFDSSNSIAHHSFSTGNLRELDDRTVVFRRSNGSDTSLPRCDSPGVVHRQSSALSNKIESPRRSKLEVPKHLSVNMCENKTEATTCLAIAVPSKTNVVAPWEGPD